MDKGGSVFQKKYRDRKTREVRTCRTWSVRYYDRNGRQCEEAGCKTEGQARKLLRKRLADKDQGLPVGPQVDRIRFKDAIKDLFADYTLKGRTTLAKVERQVALHLGPAFNDKRLISIGTDDVRKYTAERLAAGAKPATAKLELSVLKRTFRLAMQAGRIIRMPYLPMPSFQNARKGFFEIEQLQAVLPGLPKAFRPVVRFAFITGWRIPSEVLPLQWRQVDLAANEVRLEPGTTKNREGRTFILTPALKTLLESQQQRQAEWRAQGKIVPWVFPTDAGDRFKDVPRGAWARACKAAGCPGRIPHDFRRTAVRNLVRAGVPERVAMQLTGHKTRAIFDRYHIVSPEDLRQASAKLATITDAAIADAEDSGASAAPAATVPAAGIAGTQNAAKRRNARQGQSVETLRKTANSARFLRA